MDTTIYSPLAMMERMLKNTNPIVQRKGYFVEEKDNSFELEILAPGFKSSEVSVEVNGDFLIIEGKDSDSHWADDFVKKFKLPSHVNSEKISASVENGILKVSLLKKKESLPKKIKVL